MTQALIQPSGQSQTPATGSLRLPRASLGRGAFLYASCVLTLWAVQGVFAILAASTPGSATGSALPGSWIWVAALFVVGMPHGAYDLAEMARRSGSIRATVERLSWYTAVMLGCMLAFWLAPTAVLLSFLVLTMVHFGRSDSVHARLAGSDTFASRAPAYAHGMVVIAAPFAFQPMSSWAPFFEMARVVGVDASLPPQTLSGVAIVLLTSGMIVLAASAVRLWRGGSPAHATESMALPVIAIAASAVLPPLLAIGLYFVCVHALLHCLRVGSGGDGPIRAVLRAHRRALPLLLPSIAIVVALAVPLRDLGWAPALAVSFILFCVCATLPHHRLWFAGNQDA